LGEPQHPVRAGLVEREKRKVNWDPVDMTLDELMTILDGRRGH
jgi:leucyl-tRNA synthetase